MVRHRQHSLFGKLKDLSCHGGADPQSASGRRGGLCQQSDIECADYFVKLGLTHEEAHELHLKYYSQYGLALRGLTRHHDIGNALSRHAQCGYSPPSLLRSTGL